MRVWLLVLVLLLAVPACVAAQQISSAGGHIASGTTTTLIAAGASAIELYMGSFCVDSGGTATGLTLQDSSSTNIVGASVKYVIPAGACLWIPWKGTRYFNAVAAGKSLQLVTDAAGPVEWYVEVAK